MSRRGALIWAAVFAAAVVAYLPALRVGWVFDDNWNIVESPSLHWTEVSSEKLAQLVTMSGNSRRVVSNLSFAMNHLAGGLDPRGYHMVNVLIHLAVGLALAWLVALYLRGGRRESEKPIPPAAVAAPVALFLLHPLNTQAVTYVVQRMTSLAALFCILAFASYLQARRARSRGRSVAWLAASVALWFLGLASKENAAILPLVVLTWELTCGGLARGRAWETWLRWSVPTRLATGAVVLLALGVVTVVGIRLIGTPARWFDPFPNRGFSGIERVLTQSRVGILYLSLILWPAPGRLNLDHDFSVSRSLLDPPSTIAAVTFWVVAVVAAWALTRRRPLLGFPLLAYLEAHLIEAGPVNLELVFEHRNYLPLAMLSLLPAAALADVRPDRVRGAIGASVAIALALGAATFSRNALWADPVAFHRDIAKKSPEKPRAHRFLAEALTGAGRAQEALEPARRALALDTTDYQSYIHLAMAQQAAGDPAGALDTYRRAVALAPDRFQALFHVGVMLDELGHRDQALEHFTEAGTRLGMQGKAFQAIPFLQEAVKLAPESSAAHNRLGNVYGMAGRLENAIAEYRRAVELDVANVEAVYNLAYALELSGRMDEAIPHYRRFVEIAPPQLGSVVAEVRRKLEDAGAEG